MIDPETYNGDLVLFAAFRYALGRQTYLSGAVIETIYEHLPVLTDEQLRQFVKEITQAEDRNSLGDPNIDAPAWLALRSRIQKHLEHRNTHDDDH